MKETDDIDIAVTDVVMNWEVFDLGYYGSEEETPRMRELEKWIDDVGIKAVGRYAINVEQNYWREMSTGFGRWSPSTSIADAFEVIERMRTILTKEGIPLINIQTALNNNDWIVSFGVGFSDSLPIRKGFAFDASLPKAICKAALLSLEKQA